ncbi:MAG: hypothetical protein HN742_29720 [Lentisphaerae bacterium]|jgi:signal transduction histidine kinase|nr:hypothetical protein [Lentisphaerota bacterium]MBT4823011.1 hypothetical protein [Lentisphaerota bacterium]MBT5612770.1 hypothetical protein [Lentisphaerota bacterium]MBT7053986.1 hypothetical protein [Lentisphaerota bacterium]MBT7846087.1 hypothetical protein [Lentisphaerota bacterium]
MVTQADRSAIDCAGHVLVVDDEERNRRLLCDVLEKLRDNLVYMIVHDMRSLPTGALGLLEILKVDMEAEGTLRDDQASDIVQALMAGSTRREMITSLLDVRGTDTGPGIPPEYRDRIFEKFGQVEGRAEGKKYSTGLGLTFCKLAVEAHGGQIGVDSEAGKGSTFWFGLPCGSGHKGLDG